MHHKNQWNALFAIEQNTAYEAHMQDTIKLVQAQAAKRNSSAKPALSLAGLAAKQLKFLAWKIWLFQGMVLALLCTVFFLTYIVNFNIGYGNSLPEFLCGCSAVIVMSSIPILKRSSACKMFELEQSTHFAVGGSLLSQLLFIGIGDFCMLTVLVLVVGVYGLTIPIIFISLIIPFLTSAISCLMLWTRTSPDSFQTAGVALCLLASLFGYEIVDQISRLNPASQFVLYAGYLLFCIGMVYREYRRFVLHRPVEKMLW